MLRHPAHRLHQVTVTCLVSSRIGAVQNPRLYQCVRASGDCWSKRTRPIRVAATTRSAVCAIQHLAPLHFCTGELSTAPNYVAAGCQKWREQGHA